MGWPTLCCVKWLWTVGECFVVFFEKQMSSSLWSAWRHSDSDMQVVGLRRSAVWWGVCIIGDGECGLLGLICDCCCQSSHCSCFWQWDCLQQLLWWWMQLLMQLIFDNLSTVEFLFPNVFQKNFCLCANSHCWVGWWQCDIFKLRVICWILCWITCHFESDGFEVALIAFVVIIDDVQTGFLAPKARISLSDLPNSSF